MNLDIKREVPIVRKNAVVSNLKQGSSSYSRIYIDGEKLAECGFEIGDDVIIEINKVLNQITIKKR